MLVLDWESISSWQCPKLMWRTVLLRWPSVSASMTHRYNETSYSYEDEPCCNAKEYCAKHNSNDAMCFDSKQANKCNDNDHC